MRVTSNEAELNSIDRSICSLVGFHATASSASPSIEKHGFLPEKILTTADHERLLEMSTSKDIDTSFYREWLKMCSVTFAKTPAQAIAHIRNGSAGGQGLKNIKEILGKLRQSLDEADNAFVKAVECKVAHIGATTPVVYAVCLSELGPRLKSGGTYHHYYWNPSAPLPLTSEISSSRILLKLEIHS
jgi:hypothetical protein